MRAGPQGPHTKHRAGTRAWRLRQGFVVANVLAGREYNERPATTTVAENGHKE